MASSSPTNSNVSKLHREAEVLKKVPKGSALPDEAREFGIGLVTMTEIKKDREKITSLLCAEAQGVYIAP